MRINSVALISATALLIGGSSAAMADGYGYRSQPSISVNQNVIVRSEGGYGSCDPVYGCPNRRTPTHETIDQTKTHVERDWDY